MNSRPTVDDVRDTVHDLTETTGRAPSVIAVAQRLGLANTTFRRNYPEITTELQQQRQQKTVSDQAAVDRFTQVRDDNVKLRSRNRELIDHLNLAIANIQRLTVENDELRRQLEAAANVTTIRPTRP